MAELSRPAKSFTFGSLRSWQFDESVSCVKVVLLHVFCIIQGHKGQKISGVNSKYYYGREISNG